MAKDVRANSVTRSTVPALNADAELSWAYRSLKSPAFSCASIALPTRQKRESHRDMSGYTI
jgi:hypothetical protein